MREGRAPGRARQADRARQRGRERHLEQGGALHEIGHGARHDEERQPDRERHQDRPPPPSTAKITATVISATAIAPMRRWATPSRSPRFHASSGPNGTASSSGTNSGPKVSVEERRADRDLLAGQRFERERIERADEHGRAGGHQEQVVEHERAFARDRREQTALLQLRRTPGEQRERAADEQHQDRQDEDAARRVGGEGVDRGEHARAHQEGADQRQREGEDRQQDGPDLERVALLHHDRRMQQRRGGEPRHQRGVLHRVPEPPAAPAERVIGPVRAHGDAEREEDPGQQRPRPHPARPGGIDAAVDERGDGEGERDREADIADIEQRRMNREARILQDRVEIAALERRVGDAQERVGGQQDEEKEGDRDPGLHAEHVGLEPRRQIAAEQRDQRAEQRQDQHPQQHRAFVIPPHAGDLVDQRLERMGVLEHVDDREIRAQVAGDQRAERERDESELRERGRPGDAHEHRIVAARADDRHAGLHERQAQREHQSVMAELGDHRGAPALAFFALSSFQWPCFFKASATSFGM